MPAIVPQISNDTLSTLRRQTEQERIIKELGLTKVDGPHSSLQAYQRAGYPGKYYLVEGRNGTTECFYTGGTRENGRVIAKQTYRNREWQPEYQLTEDSLVRRQVQQQLNRPPHQNVGPQDVKSQEKLHLPKIPTSYRLTSNRRLLQTDEVIIREAFMPSNADKWETIGTVPCCQTGSNVPLQNAYYEVRRYPGMDTCYFTLIRDGRPVMSFCPGGQVAGGTKLGEHIVHHSNNQIEFNPQRWPYERMRPDAQTLVSGFALERSDGKPGGLSPQEIAALQGGNLSPSDEIRFRRPGYEGTYVIRYNQEFGTYDLHYSGGQRFQSGGWVPSAKF